MHIEPRITIGLEEAQERLRPMLDFVPVDNATKHDLCRKMSGDDRFYHGIDHLVVLWNRHRLYEDAGALRGHEIDHLIASAIAFHDAVCVYGRHDNEELSAQFWLHASRGSSMPEIERSWVADTIRATKSHLAYAPEIVTADDRLPITLRARLWLLDLDLTAIGEEAADFDANTERLRAESELSPNENFDEDRLMFLRQLDVSPQIFRSPVLASAFEKPARENVRRHLSGGVRRVRP